MRLAYLILVHNNPRQLNRLIGRLTYDGADFYVHVDEKTDIRPFLPIKKWGNVHFITKRETIHWAGYSMVQATLNGLNEILATGNPYDNITLMSGQDYPIKSNAEIQEFFAANPGKIFMDTLSVENEWREAIPRITQYHMPDLNFPGKHTALRVVNTLIPRRKMPMDLTPVGRSQWFSIPLAGAAYITEYMEQHHELARFFKKSWAPDEMIFQTILYGSHYNKDMVNNNLVYVDWTNGKASPKILTIADAEALGRSTKLFARKFNPEIDPEILDYLDKKQAKT